MKHCVLTLNSHHKFTEIVNCLFVVCLFVNFSDRFAWALTLSMMLLWAFLFVLAGILTYFLLPTYYHLSVHPQVFMELRYRLTAIAMVIVPTTTTVYQVGERI